MQAHRSAIRRCSGGANNCPRRELSNRYKQRRGAACCAPTTLLTARFCSAARLDPPAARSSANCRTPRCHALASPKSPAVPALHPKLTHALHEPLAHLLVARLLHRVEIARHLAILILLELEHLRAPGLHPIHQFAHAIGVRGDPGLHLVLQRPTTLHLLLHRGAPASAVPLLSRTQLARLVLRQVQVLLDPARERRLDLRPQPPRFVRIARLLRPEHWRHNDPEAK